MVDLRAGLGAPPIVFPGVQMQRIGVPNGLPGRAPISTMAQAAGQHVNLGCGGCTRGVGDLVPWWSRVPLWAKIGAGVVLLGGVSYAVYRIVR